ncbi:hypothetical protein HTG_00110 [Natrinema mahii]|nr:hypothetical protein HTG_00110 [Natrinema mahii]
MSLNSPSRTLPSDRSNRLGKVTTTQDRQPHLWADSTKEFDGFARLLNALAERMTTDEAVNICLLVECIADHFAHGYTTIRDGATTIDLARGHADLNQLLSPSTLERAEAFDVIETPTVYDGWERLTRHQIARRTLWDLGPVAKEYLDMQAIRGYDEETSTLRSDANEGIVHRYILRLTEHVYRGKNKYVKTYVKADTVTDIREDLGSKVYDLVAYDDGSIYATCEVEMRPLDRAHVADDARLQAAIPGDSDWVVYRKQDTNRLLATFVSDGAIELPDGHPGWGDALDLSTNNAMERLERIFDAPDGTVPALESPIVTTVNTADNVREMAQESRPEIFRELNLD